MLVATWISPDLKHDSGCNGSKLFIDVEPVSVAPGCVNERKLVPGPRLLDAPAFLVSRLDLALSRYAAAERTAIDPA
jgi:hypothetical protein